MDSNNEEKYAGFWVRGLAWFIDALIVGIPIKMLEAILDADSGITIILSLILLWGYYGYFVYRWRATIGKKIVGIEILNYDLTPVSLTKASLRFMYSLITYLILFSPIIVITIFALINETFAYIGFIMVLAPIAMMLFTEKKQVLHDYFAKTVVVDTTKMLQNRSTDISKEKSYSDRYAKIEQDIEKNKGIKYRSIVKLIRTLGIIVMVGYGVYALYVFSVTAFVFGSLALHKSHEFHKNLKRYQKINDHNDSRVKFYVEELNKSGEEYLQAATVPRVFKARVKRKLALNCIGYFLQKHHDETWLEQVEAVDRNQLNAFEQNTTLYYKRKDDKDWKFYNHFYFNEIYEVQEKVASSFEEDVSRQSCEKLQTTEKMFEKFLPLYISTKESTLQRYIEDEKTASYFGTLNKGFYRKSIKEMKRLLAILYTGFPKMKEKKEIEQRKLEKEYQKALLYERKRIEKKRKKARKAYENSKMRKEYPLFAAIQHHYYEDVKKLLDGGIDPNRVEKYDKLGFTPLFIAISNNDIPAIKLLIEHGANMRQMDENNFYNPFTWAVDGGDKNIGIVKLLLNGGADVNYQYNNSETALTIAAKGCKNYKLVELLLDYGADPYLVDEYGYNTLTGLKRYCRDKAAYNKMKKLIEENAK